MTDIATLLADKTIKAKEKVGVLSQGLLEGKIKTEELITVAEKSKDADKGNCIEAFEYATKQKPDLGTKVVLEFAIQCLSAKTPRVKWEAAKVIGNVAKNHPSVIEKALPGLLTNSEHQGAVVRWSAAFALGEILKLGSKMNEGLIPAVEAIITREEKNSIRKIYQDAIRKLEE